MAARVRAFLIRQAIDSSRRRRHLDSDAAGLLARARSGGPLGSEPQVRPAAPGATPACAPTAPASDDPPTKTREHP